MSMICLFFQFSLVSLKNASALGDNVPLREQFVPKNLRDLLELCLKAFNFAAFTFQILLLRVHFLAVCYSFDTKVVLF